MLERCSIGAMALGLALGAAVAGAWAHDESQYPDLKGQWVGLNAKADAPWDPIKPPGRAQQAPLTPEYQAIFEATLARQAQGALNPNTCLPPGMPRTMIVHQPMEIIVMPDTTYMMLSYMSEFRRIYTDGRKWPEDIEPAYAGYSIGQWERAAGDGRYDTLVIETRRSPHTPTPKLTASRKAPSARRKSKRPIRMSRPTIISMNSPPTKTDLPTSQKISRLVPGR